jgi:acetylornithine/succinyldiaminopimelate/putrescine aminotransferase
MMTAAGYEVGLWAFFAGFERSVLQFKPGLLIRREECDELLGLVEKAISLCEERHGVGAAES